MRKLVLTIILATMLLLLTISSISATHSADIDLTPLKFYETTESDFNMTVNNFGSENVITDLTANLSGFMVTNVTDYAGWNNNYTNEKIRWYDGTLETNILLALFQFRARAPKVDDDSTGTIEIITEDDEGFEQSHRFNISIINDYTAPVISDQEPVDGGYVKEGEDQETQLRAEDPETGILETRFDWELCIVPVNTTDNQSGLISLTEEDPINNSGLYAGTADLSGYSDSDLVCFNFEAENNGGEVTTSSGMLTIDGFAPTVDLLAPEDGAMLGATDGFVFVADDNLAPTLDCDFLSDSNIDTSLTVNSGENSTVSALNVTEGEHDWSVTCKDLAGWQTTSASRSYILDKTPPSIVLEEPANGSIMAAGTQVHISVTDNYALDSVTYSINGGNQTAGGADILIDTSDWSDGASTLLVTAADAVGNINDMEFTFIIDRTPPVVTLLLPTNETDVHTSFEFLADDTYDASLECQLIVNGTMVQEVSNVTNSIYTINQIVEIGDHDWRIECIDDAANIGTSDTWNLTVIDTTGPDMLMNNTDSLYRGETLDLSVEVSDVSGISFVGGVLEGPSGQTTNLTFTNVGGDSYIASVDTQVDWEVGVYTLTVNSEDNAANPSSLSENIQLDYSYAITLTLDPSSVLEGRTVTARGNVLFDNGNVIPQDTINLALPSGNVAVDVDNGINGTGNFVHAFSAPGNGGVYTITASVTANNGHLFSEDAQLSVQEEHSSSSSTGGSSGSGCQEEWLCGAWSECFQGTQSRTCRATHCTTSTVYRTEDRSCTDSEPAPVEAEFDSDDNSDGNGDGNSGYIELDTDDDGSDGNSGYVEDNNTVVEEPAPVIGIGHATSFFNFNTLDIFSILSIIALIVALLLTLAHFGWNDDLGGQQRPGDISKSLEDYLNGRN